MSLRQRSEAQKQVLGQQGFEEWRRQGHLKRKALIEKGIVSIEKKEQTLCLKVKGWCVAVCMTPYKNFGKVIQAVCNTIFMMEYDDAQKILQ